MSLVLELRSSHGEGVAHDVMHLAWSDAGGQALLAAATSHSVAVFSLHRSSFSNVSLQGCSCGCPALKSLRW